MSGRASTIKGYFSALGCGHVFGLLLRRRGSAGGLFYHEDMLAAIESQFGAKEIEIRLSHAVAMGGQDRTLSLPWTPPSPYQRREIIEGEGEPRSPIRPMRVRARAVCAESLRHAHRGLDEPIRNPHQTIEVFGAREHRSERSIRMHCRWLSSTLPSSPQRFKAACGTASDPST
jgi:hypothetical protein